MLHSLNHSVACAMLQMRPLEKGAETHNQITAWEVSEWRNGSVIGSGGWLTHLLRFIQISWMAYTFAQMTMR